ncbi:MBL fold metallo-hydrolase [Candidatus Formimonas warabiya]|uniref:MBL fold metallo-hydrolase n=1 Tax=Formimonas warabiya TaxID=1761012 RepID=A0A3G1KVW5_FORW1|nr:MBL fold metallo-hydrolase [Candidatus Formimonas warabiya]ATW26592.1 MBL fold metallo-hydrolase [Candidatus Formimonas warabiya]
MKIADGIEMLEIPAHLMAGPGIINPVLFWDKDEVVLVDAGFPHQVQQFRDAFAKAGVPFDRLSRVIVTHADADHVGGLAGILHDSPQKITIFAHEKERPYIEAELPPIRLAQMEAQLKILPEERRQQVAVLYESLKANYKKLGANVDETVEDGEQLPYCGGIKVVYTPGHTPGHICLYHQRSKTLVAGDAFNVEGGVLVHAPEFTCLDKEQYDKSLKKLAMYDIETVLCYHGGLYRDHPNRSIAELAGIN